MPPRTFQEKAMVALANVIDQFQRSVTANWAKKDMRRLGDQVPDYLARGTKLLEPNLLTVTALRDTQVKWLGVVGAAGNTDYALLEQRLVDLNAYYQALPAIKAALAKSD